MEPLGPHVASALWMALALGSGAPPGVTQALLPPAPQSSGHFGEAVAFAGERLVVGAPGVDGAAPRSGAALVFAPDRSGGFALEATLVPAAGATGDRFGAALAAEGGVVAVAAPGVAVHLFERAVGGTWIELQALAPEDLRPHGFGADLALEGDRLLVGAPERHLGAGAAYLFERAGPGARFELRQVVRPRAPAPGAAFGARLDADGPLAVVSAPGWRPADAPPGAPPVGAALLFARNGAGLLVELQPLAPGYGGPVEEYGADVALDGTTVVVGAPGKAVGGLNGVGAALLFEPAPRSRGRAGTVRPGAWVPVRELLAGDGQADDGFGRAVSVDGDLVLVGAPDTVSGGAVYVFGRDAGGPGAWGELAALPNPTGFGDFFGAAVDHHGGRGLAGAPAADVGPAGGAGAAYALGRWHR